MIGPANMKLASAAVTECGLFLLVLRDGALQLGRYLLTLAGVDGCRQLGPQFLNVLVSGHRQLL
ncbi:hypothetical protein SmedWSM1115_33520 (plasmid) [Sinorhizobium medicae WSM1115]|uniref:hypothetical protein n=1 Tax=Sinorhizobium medicae TaxID=110321 RepID=UPI00035D58F2|nr:hypothetical protein [Sinorhizobium medicae]UFX06659.1 hypothetical protein SmedWSM1115_33520 [Sinorhizobium medicae WSM1115]